MPYAYWGYSSNPSIGDSPKPLYWGYSPNPGSFINLYIILWGHKKLDSVYFMVILCTTFTTWWVRSRIYYLLWTFLVFFQVRNLELRVFNEYIDWINDFALTQFEFPLDAWSHCRLKFVCRNPTKSVVFLNKIANGKYPSKMSVNYNACSLEYADRLNHQFWSDEFNQVTRESMVDLNCPKSLQTNNVGRPLESTIFIKVAEDDIKRLTNWEALTRSGQCWRNWLNDSIIRWLPSKQRNVYSLPQKKWVFQLFCLCIFLNFEFHRSHLWSCWTPRDAFWWGISW
jgi:hypothetical protein